jgi:hypothetical protein
VEREGERERERERSRAKIREERPGEEWLVIVCNEGRERLRGAENEIGRKVDRKRRN